MTVLPIDVGHPNLLDALDYPMSIYCQIKAAIAEGHPITHFRLYYYGGSLKPFPIAALVHHCENRIKRLP